MKQMKHGLHSLLAVTVCGLLLLAVFTGCEPEKETVTEYIHDTTFVDVTTYIHIISVDDVVASPDSIAVGGSITLTADVSTEEDLGEIKLNWFAEAGSFDITTGDTVTWMAPDDAGTYKIVVHASDENDTEAGVGSRLIGVGMYVPTLEPYFVGNETCSGCHATTATAMAETGHSHAWASLMESDNAASYCFGCHSVGYFGTSVGADSLGGDAGYDESPIALYENVQCENCHGPGSSHAAGPANVDMTVSWDAETCGTCHEGSHHPYMTEWEESAHNFDPETAAYGAATLYGGACSGCHEGIAGGYRLSGDLTAFYGSGSVADRPSFDDIPAGNISCQTCHDSHSADNPGQLRTVADIQLVENDGATPIITEGGTGKLCMQCHHARRSADTQLADGYGHFGPHASPQADVLAGESAYHGVAAASFAWAGPSHLNVQNSCKTCHINMVEYNPTDGAITGHTFEPTTAACENCHGTIDSFEDIMALEDFDGDGSVEGLQLEVDGLLHHLEVALTDSFITAGVDTTGGFDLIHELGIVTHYPDPSDSTITFDAPLLWREAGYNLAYVEDDKSRGIHNPDYVVQLLQQSYMHLTGSMPGAAVRVEGDRVVSAW